MPVFQYRKKFTTTCFLNLAIQHKQKVRYSQTTHPAHTKTPKFSHFGPENNSQAQKLHIRLQKVNPEL